MRVQITPIERQQLERITGANHLRSETIRLAEQYRLARTMGGASGQIPFDTLVHIAVESGGMRQAYAEHADEYRNKELEKQEAARAIEDAIPAERRPETVESTTAETLAEVAAPKKENGYFPGQLMNYRAKSGAWLPCNYIGPGVTSDKHIVVEASGIVEPFEVSLSKIDVPNLAAPIEG